MEDAQPHDLEDTLPTELPHQDMPLVPVEAKTDEEAESEMLSDDALDGEPVSPNVVPPAQQDPVPTPLQPPPPADRVADEAQRKKVFDRKAYYKLQNFGRSQRILDFPEMHKIMSKGSLDQKRALLEKWVSSSGDPNAIEATLTVSAKRRATEHEGEALMTVRQMKDAGMSKPLVCISSCVAHRFRFIQAEDRGHDPVAARSA